MTKRKQRAKKSIETHSEDALYREVWEEVHTQKIYNFIKNNLSVIIIVSTLLLSLVIGIVIFKHIKTNNALEITNQFESAMNMTEPKLSREALSRLAKNSNEGMSDLAMFRAYQLAILAGDRADALRHLEKLVSNGKTRDFRDLALIKLASMKEISGDSFQKMMAPVLTKRSPFYYNGLLLVAQKYLSENKKDLAKPFLEKITKDDGAPEVILGAAEMLD